MQELWQKHIQYLRSIEAHKMVDQPCEFQRDLLDYMSPLIRAGDKVIEMGCELGLTTFLLPDNCQKYLLDINIDALDYAREIYQNKNKQAEFINADMFDSKLPNDLFNVVYNAGVLEHFQKADRLRAIKEYVRILAPGGHLVLAVPNHFSFPYRVAYILLNFVGRWRYPKEYRIHDFCYETSGFSNLEFISRKTVAKETPFNALKFGILKKLFKWFDKFFNFEGYLLICHYRKK